MFFAVSSHEPATIKCQKQELPKVMHSEVKSFPRWLMVATGLVMLTLIGGGSWYYIYQEQTFREKSEANLQAAAELKVNQIAEWRSEKLRDAKAFMASPLLIDAVDRWLANPQSELAEKILSQFRSVQELFHYRDVMLVDRDGQVRLSLLKHQGSLHEEAARSLVKALRDGRPVMTDLHAGPADLPPHIDVVVPLFSETDKTKDPNSAVILQIDARRFLYPLIQFWPTPSVSAETLLVRKDGNAVLFLNDLRHQPDTALKLRIPLSKKSVPAVMAVLGKEGIVQGTDYRGVEVLSVLKAIPNSPWFMVSKMDEAEALAGWRFRSIIILVLVIALLTSLFTAVGVVWQKTGKAHYKELFLAETALRKVEEGHRITLMSVGDGIISTDVNGRVEILNPVAEALTGWQHEEARGKPLEEVFRIFNEQTRQPVENPVSKVLKEGHVVGLANHTMLVAQDGTERPIADSAAPIRDEHGEIIGVVLVFRDQSEQRAAQRNLTQEKEKAQQYLDVARVMLIALDASGHVTMVNRKGCEILGCREDDILGKDWFENFLPEKVREEAKGVFSRIMSGHLETDVYVESVVIANRGEARLIAWHNSILRDQDGSIIGTLSSGVDITDRKAMEEALQESEERYRAVFDNAGIGIDVLDRNGRILQVNRSLLDMLGYSEEELLQLAFLDITHPEEREVSKSQLEALMTGEIDFYRLEKRYLRKDRSVFWADLTTSAVRGPNGEHWGTIGVISDITDRKKAEAALRENEERYRLFFETSRDGVFMTRLDGQFIDFNDVALEMFGYAPDEKGELLEKNVANVYANSEERAAHTTLVSKQGFSKEYPLDLRKKDGTIIHALATTVARRDPQGTIIGFQGTVRDITERKRAEEELKNTLQRFYSILSNLYAAVLLVSDEGQVEFANQAFCDLFHLDDAPLDLRGLGAAEMIHKIQEAYAHPAEAVARIQEVVAEQSPVRGEEIAMRGGKTYLVDFIPLLVDGKRSGRLWHHQDITNRKRSEELVLQSARLQSVADLSSGVAHHFNNLLQIVMASTSLSLADLESGDLSEIKTNLEKMLRAATFGAETVKRLQTFANVRVDVTESESAVFDLANAARNAVEVSQPLWKSDAEKKGIKIDLQLDLQDGCLVKGQENEMFEVLVNLIKNAAEAMPQGGDIDVKAHREADEVVIAIRDTGTGIAEEDLPRVFQPFWSSKGVGIGKGMGLAVSHGLVKRHGGSISVDSKEGVGTTFTIRLPLAQDPVTKAEQSSMSTSGDHLTIVVIDDDVNIASLLERICAKEGHTVYRALSGQEGLAVFNKESVDLVISDLGMAGMNGWEVGKAIQSICQERGITKPPFILLTGYGGQELEKEKITESGVDAVVAKPIDRTTVLATVQEIAGLFAVMCG